MSQLFDPAIIGNLRVKNRIFMAPLTRNRAHANGVPSDLAIEYYHQRATAGLIITEASQVNAMGKGYDDTPGIYTDAHIAQWKRITDAVHDRDGKIFMQLWHVGRISHSSLLPDGAAPLAPSAIKANAQTYANGGMVDVSAPREMTQADIDHTIEAYRHAAACAKKAGFDGIEVHAANGYLINQFLCDTTNRRDDAYGGSIEARYRFLDEVMNAVGDVWESGNIGIRLSPTGSFNDMGDSDPKQHFGYVIDQLNARNLAYLHVVERFPGVDTSHEDEAIVSALTQQWEGFYIANGDFDKQMAQRYLSEGRAQAVAFGRPYIANPDLPERLAVNAPLNTPDDSTFYGGDHRGYTDYPTLADGEQVA